VSEEELVKRLNNRRICANCGKSYNLLSSPPKIEGVCDLDGAPLMQRSDDNLESVSKRFEEYRESTAPLIDYYRQSGRLIELNGELSESEVFKNLWAAIDGAEN
jgi:adenylate kinase